MTHEEFSLGPQDLDCLAELKKMISHQEQLIAWQRNRLKLLEINSSQYRLKKMVDGDLELLTNTLLELSHRRWQLETSHKALMIGIYGPKAG